MTKKDLDKDHLETLDRDLDRFGSLKTATSGVARPFGGLGLALIFIITAGLFSSLFLGSFDNRIIVIVAAVLGAYMAINIGANDVANNMGPAVGANSLTLAGAIAIAIIFESAGALIAGGDVVSTIAKGIVDPSTMQS